MLCVSAQLAHVKGVLVQRFSKTAAHERGCHGRAIASQRFLLRARTALLIALRNRSVTPLGVRRELGHLRAERLNRRR